MDLNDWLPGMVVASAMISWRISSSVGIGSSDRAAAAWKRGEDGWIEYQRRCTAAAADWLPQCRLHPAAAAWIVVARMGDTRKQGGMGEGASGGEEWWWW